MKVSVKRIFQKVHRWLGLGLCIPLVLSGLSGSYLVADRMIGDMMPSQNQSIGTPLPLDILIQKAVTASETDGKKMRVSFVRMPENPTDPTFFFIQPQKKAEPQQQGKDAPPKRRGTRVTLDSITGEKVEPQANSFNRLLHDYHANMLLKDYAGRTIVGWWGVALLFFSISGVVLWWPKKGKLKQSLKVKSGTSPYRFNRDLHSVGGIWLGALLILSSFTGTAIVFPDVIKPMVAVLSNPENKAFESIKVSESFPDEQPSVTDIVGIASQNRTDVTLHSVRFPEKPSDTYQVAFAKTGQSFDKPTLKVFVDGGQKTVVAVDDPANWTAGQIFMAWMRPLHEGKGLGVLWQVLTFITGLMPAFFAYTGVKMYVVRRMNKRQSVSSSSPHPSEIISQS